jgi:hypothetical protein
MRACRLLGVSTKRRSTTTLGLSAVGFSALLVAIGSLGCDVVTSVGPQSCDRDPEDNPPTDYRGGSAEGGIYMSSDWDGELVQFQGGAQIRFFHGLGAEPRSWAAYVSFERYGADGSMAPAAGNQAELVAIDDQSLTLRNSSCADYFLLVTATAHVGESPTDS